MTAINRRSFLAAAAGGIVLTPTLAGAAQAQVSQPPVSSTPTPRDWSGQQPLQYPDPDVVALDNRFRRYMVGEHTDQAAPHGDALGRRSGLERRGALPGVERHPEQRSDALDRRRRPRHRLPQPVGLQQRQHLRLRGPAALLRARRPPRRPVRAQRDDVTVIADKFQGKRLNSPNDVVVHPDGGIWFTDPIYGIRGNYEGFKAEPETKEAVYRIDPKTGQIDKVTDEIVSPTASASRPTTRSSMSPTPARRATSRSGMSTARRCAVASGSSRWTYRGRARRRSPTGSAATSTATSGRARGPGSR